MTDLSIIIVSYKDWNRLFKCLDSLRQSPDELLSYEVIIVDNCSDDGMFEKCPSLYPEFIFIRNEINGGFGNGCNRGAREASGEYLLFLNPDTIVEMGALCGLLNIIKSNPSYTLASCVQPDEHGRNTRVSANFPSLSNLTGWQRSFFSHDLKKSPGADGMQYPDWVSGSVMMISRSKFAETGSFDDDYWMYFEDVDLCRRLTDNGGKVVLTDKVTIEHNHGGSSRVNLKTTSLTKCEVMISQHVYVSKHFKGVSKMSAHIFLIINNIITGLFESVAGIILFFNKRMFARVIIFGRLTGYYFNALLNGTWISPRSVNFPFKKQS